MKYACIVCFFLFGAAHLAQSQTKGRAARPIPGYLDPATGKFTARIAPIVQDQAGAAATTAPQAVFFREDFQITIANYDQPGTTAVCEVEMSSSGDANSVYYSETASVAATATGGGFSCDVPVLTLWMLQTPTTDTIYASVSVSIYSQATPIPIYRSSTQSLTLTQPANSQTVVNTIKFQI